MMPHFGQPVANLSTFPAEMVFRCIALACCSTPFLLLFFALFETNAGSRLSVNENGGNHLRRSHANKLFISQLEEGSYEIVHPFQVRDRKERVGIDTRNHFLNSTPPAHCRTGVNIVIRSTVLANARMKLMLALNEHILHEKSRFRMLKRSEETVLSPVENCYYQGTINGNPDSMAAVSTCDGLHGILTFSNGTTLAIWPLEGGERTRRHPHILYRPRMRTSESRCAALTQVRRVNKFLELALIGDHHFMRHFNNSHEKAIEYVLNAINLADLVLRRDLGIRLSVPFAEFWPDSQRIESATTDAQLLLGSLLDYVTGHLYDVEKDATILLTGQEMAAGDTTTASFGSVCTSRAVGLVQANDPFTTHLSALTLAHSVGHILGIGHDSSECTCGVAEEVDGRPTTVKQCVMADTMSPLSIMHLHFSQCSIARLHSFLHQSQSPQLQCLFVRPFQTSRLYQCGNGVLDGDEQCDCGRRDQCNDPCCDPLSCQLKSHAQCASHQPCCHHCQFRPSEHVCRQSQSVCDVVEKCDGSSGECPQDEHLVDGVLCGLSGHCWKGQCMDGERQCRQLWGSGSKPADELCFDYNSKGVEYGNCGKDGEGRFVECARENARCGVLHCRGGSVTPIDRNSTSFNFQFVHEHRHVQCKVVTNSPEGMVKNGSSCGQGRVCVRSVCVPLAQVSPLVQCPSNNMALQCSGHGDCTTGQHCLCFEDWTGPACDVRVPMNSSTRRIVGHLSEDHGRGIELMMPPIRMNGKALETATLLGILLLVGLLLLLLLICLLLFYKRKSSSRTCRDRQTERTKVADEEGCEDGNGGQDPEGARVIKFQAALPSYREEKRKRKTNKRVYDALQRITEANEVDALSVKSRESSSVGAVVDPNRTIPQRGVSSSVVEMGASGSSSVNRPPPGSPSPREQIRYSASPVAGDEWRMANKTGGTGGYAMDTELARFGPLNFSEGDVGEFSSVEHRRLPPSAEFDAFIAPPRLAHIQMLMRRLEGATSGGFSDDLQLEEEGRPATGHHSPAPSGGVAPPASADSGHPGSNFDIRGESPSLFSDPYKLDRLDLPG